MYIHQIVYLCVFLALASFPATTAQAVAFSPMEDGILLAGHGSPRIQIFVSSEDYAGVLRTAKDLALDIGRVVGVNGTAKSVKDVGSVRGDVVVIVGTIGSSTLIDNLVEDGKLDVSEVQGQWESYVHQLVEKPFRGVSRALVIAGSDKRGTIFGTYDVSESIGVSPWYWWADVPIKPQKHIYLQQTTRKVQGPPSVKYRGIFINDEDQLILWAEGKFEKSPRGGYFTRDFYRLVFELLLRLRANYMWPGMKREEAFYLDDPENGSTADEYGIVIGTSHHEPMARAYNEQLEEMEGAWDWGENSEEIADFMEVGVERTKGYETAYTMGMRGEGDRESPTLTPEQLEEIIGLQQNMIENMTNKSLENTPQIWALYKEVGKYWEAGMDVSELVTLMFSDDNFGNLLRVPTGNETDRKAGSGVYYHFGYVGDPRNYMWISTTQLVKTWEQMHFAYERGAREIWITNVQDLKPQEIPATHFLDMAYNMDKFQKPESTTDWLRNWASRTFNSGVADEVAEIYNIYGRLVVRRKYETLSMEPFAWSTLHYDEAENVLQEWSDLLTIAQDAHDSLEEKYQDAFFELVLHPVMAGKTVQEVYVKTALAKLYLEQERTSTNVLAAAAKESFQIDQEITNRYHRLFDGKWDQIMDQPHIGYIERNPPKENLMPNITYIHDGTVGTDGGPLGVAIQGSNQSYPSSDTLRLRELSFYTPKADRRYIDGFARLNDTFSFEITSNSTFLKLSKGSGSIKAPGKRSDVRSYIEVDWDKAPHGSSEATIQVLRTDDDATGPATLTLPLRNERVPDDFCGFIEANEFVSIESENFSSSSERGEDVSYAVIPHYGRTKSGVKLWPASALSQTVDSGPKLSYNFYTFEERKNAEIVLYLGGTLNVDPDAPLRLAYSLDGGETVEKRVFEDYEAGDLPTHWDTAVITGGWNVTVMANVDAGEHVLDVWLLEPGVILQKLVVNLGGLFPSALGPPESRRNRC